MPTDLIDYVTRLAPGLALVCVCSALLRGSAGTGLRAGILVLGFVLVRDAMTPLGFWRFGVTQGWVPWIRFTEDAVVLLVLAAASLLAAVLIPRADRELGARVRWGTLGPRAMWEGIVGAAAVVIPFVALSTTVPLAERGGVVAVSALPSLLVFCLAGNFLEEVLFRGIIQGELERRFRPIRTVIVSGLLFAACHAFLASTLTDIGWPLLAFTAVEGVACAWVRHRNGVLAATVTHGSVIFVLASGLH